MPLQIARVEPGIAVLRLDRPERRNALDSALLVELIEALDGLAAEPELRVLVLSTTNTDAFSAGADITEALDTAGGIARMDGFTRLYAAMDAFPAPVICVCVGNCVGAGAEIACGADLRVAGENLQLFWPGGRLGVPVGVARLVPLVGISRAKELILTGRVMRAEEARHLGLAHRVVPAEEAEATALELAAELARHEPDGLRRLKAMFRDFEDSAHRVQRENAILANWQRHGSGLPYGGLTG
jgi:enoyl-CoA hydratase/carnithine racemase